MAVRVGAFSLSAFMGGAERWMLDLIRHTKGPDVQWPWLVVGDNTYNTGPIMAEARKLVPVVQGPSALARLSAEVDVVVGWGLHPRQCRAPVIVTSHWDGGSSYATSLLAKTAPGAAAVVAVSKVALNPVPGRRGIVIYNGVDPKRVRPTLPRDRIRAELGIPRGQRVLGYLGRLSDEKRIGAILKAAPRLPRNWSTVLVGMGSTQKARRKRVLRGNKPIFPGARADIGNVLQVFDRLVITSKHEGFGLVIAEAWLAGVPVIATPVGIAKEHPELVRLLPGGADGMVGKQLADAVVGDAQAAQRAKRARKYAQEHLTTEVFGRRWRELLLEFGPGGKRQAR